MSYTPLFDVTVEHEYFGPGPCPSIELVPDARTRELESRAGVLIRAAPGTVAVYFDSRNVEPLRLHASDAAEPLRFVFRVRATDVSLASYTDPDSFDRDAIHFYSSKSARVAEDGEATWDGADRIVDHDFARMLQLRNRHDPETDVRLRPSDADARLLDLSGVVEHRDRIVPPLAIVGVFIPSPGKSDPFPPTVPSRYRLGFRALRTIWKYYLFGDLAQKESANIADLNGDGDVAEFERGPKENLPGNRVALTFRSRAPIPLRHRSERRLQLRENGKVLIRRLPVASPDALGSVETDGGKKQFVSDIYVNG